jgi:hypothetical protein
MVPPHKEEEDELEYPQSSISQTESAPTGDFLAGGPMPITTSTSTIPPTPTPINDYYDPSKTTHPKGYPPFTGPPYWVTNGVQYPPAPWVPSSSTWTTLPQTATLSQGLETAQVQTSSYALDTGDATSPTSVGYGNQRPNWHGGKERMHSGRMYAAAAITPIVVLAMVGAIVFLCMRKRKRQRVELAAVQTKGEEMKLHGRSPPISQAYMASPSNASPQYTSTGNHSPLPPDPALLHPIILGPISSGTNGAYFTGIDTSDVISMTSANDMRPGPPNPFSDNDSLAEPPPPYRPRSTAPPSLTNSSRQSSFRASVAPPATSRTHLIERSPFEDPFEDDAISDLSGPTAGQGDDAMSAVSDLSYQNDPVVNRSSI